LSSYTDNISLHLKNIFADGEMTEEPTGEDFSLVRQEYAIQDPGLGSDLLYEEFSLE
jgi:hypothetical protein